MATTIDDYSHGVAEPVCSSEFSSERKKKKKKKRVGSITPWQSTPNRVGLSAGPLSLCRELIMQGTKPAGPVWQQQHRKRDDNKLFSCLAPLPPNDFYVPSLPCLQR